MEVINIDESKYPYKYQIVVQADEVVEDDELELKDIKVRKPYGEK